MASKNKSAGMAPASSLTAADTSGTPTARAKRVGILLSEIADLATVFEHLGANIVEHAGSDEGPDASQVTMDGVCVRELAGKLGWMADLATQLHDQPFIVNRGGAEHWMLSPVYRNAMQTSAPPLEPDDLDDAAAGAAR
jgi:hypothetical protein